MTRLAGGPEGPEPTLVGIVGLLAGGVGALGGFLVALMLETTRREQGIARPTWFLIAFALGSLAGLVLGTSEARRRTAREAWGLVPRMILAGGVVVGILLVGKWAGHWRW